MKKTTAWAAVLMGLLLLTGCGQQAAPASSGETSAAAAEVTPFEEGQLYAAAYLGYREIHRQAYDTEVWPDSERLPVHYLSGGEYYLIVPRYEKMTLRLYRNDINTLEPQLIYEDPDCRPFLVQCNASDIFADAVISLTHEGETVEFSPYISLENGSVQIGERGLDITKQENG